jgi:predicted transcriptional regulator
MTRKRSKLEIYLEILRTINEGENKPTRIMYRTNLSWIPLQQIFESMVAQELIKETALSIRKEYAITEKGKSVLHYFNGMTRLIQIEYKAPKIHSLR